MRKFDFYEFTAVLIPGVVLLFGFSRIIPTAWGPTHDKEFTASELALFTFLAYAAGHIIQSFGNWLEPRVWRFFSDDAKFLWSRNGAEGGDETPMKRFRRNPETLLSKDQIDLLKTQFPTTLRIPWTNLSTLTKEEWTPIHWQIYAEVQRAGLDERCNIFTANYAMMRGLLASFLTVLFGYPVIAFFSEEVYWTSNGLFWQAILVAGSICAVKRMTQFSLYSARETLVQFLTIKPESSNVVAAGATTPPGSLPPAGAIPTQQAQPAAPSSFPAPVIPSPQAPQLPPSP